jgi:RES domain-containing protein
VTGQAVTSVPVSGVWLRHAPANSDPLYRPPTPADGRWQRGSSVEGVYLAADEATVWAEWYRWLAEYEIEPMRGLPRELWRYRVNIRRVADLTTDDAFATLGLPDAQPGRDQWDAFQKAGERLHAEGFEGLMYRSAARPQGVCLCVFRVNAADSLSKLEPLAPPRLIERPPAPPRGLRT